MFRRFASPGHGGPTPSGGLDRFWHSSTGADTTTGQPDDPLFFLAQDFLLLVPMGAWPISIGGFRLTPRLDCGMLKQLEWKRPRKRARP
jgi:hypothetical protein